MARLLRYMMLPPALPVLFCLLLVLLLALHPTGALGASLRGLAIWWDVLFPALFPFFLMAELMLGFGIVHFFGTLLDPLMRPVFRLPGIAGFVVTMGFVSGYPVGSRLAAQLREREQISRAEGERLVAFTTSSDPVFLIGAVSVGFFHNAAIAPILAVAHYGGSVIIGLLARFHARGEPMTPKLPSSDLGRVTLKAAVTAMHEARLADGRPFGRLLQDAIGSALRLNIVVGGLVVFFSVVMYLLQEAQVLQWLAGGLNIALEAAGLPAPVTGAFVNGLFEVTLGAKAAGEASAPLMHMAAAAAFVLSWAGLSVHAQVASIIGITDIRYKPFLIARAVHGFVAFALVYMLWGWLGV